MKKFLLLVLSFACTIIHAQDNNYGVKGFYPQTFTITDTTPVIHNGLKAAYTIKDESEKSVGKKGDFSRYKISFALTNTSTEAKIMYRNLSFGGHSGPMNNNIALFKCLNATGARMTNKMASMELLPCQIEALVDNKKVTADIDFWIKPGETVSKTYPMIVPLGERPNVTITFYPEVGNQTGTVFNDQYNEQPNYQPEFVRLKNSSSNQYLHNQNGPLSCSDIDYQWWSAQWEILPVAGTNNFQVRNRWKNSFISIDNSGMLSDNGNTAGSMWLIEEAGTANLYYIRNVASNAKLILRNGQLSTGNSYHSNDSVAQWIIEK